MPLGATSSHQPNRLKRNDACRFSFRDNNVDQALKVLKKKMQREGVFREMKLRSRCEKPSEEGKIQREGGSHSPRPQAGAGKKLQREGLLPMKPRVVPARGGAARIRSFRSYGLH